MLNGVVQILMTNNQILAKNNFVPGDTIDMVNSKSLPRSNLRTFRKNSLILSTPCVRETSAHARS